MYVPCPSVVSLIDACAQNCVSSVCGDFRADIVKLLAAAVIDSLPVCVPVSCLWTPCDTISPLIFVQTFPLVVSAVLLVFSALVLVHGASIVFLAADCCYTLKANCVQWTECVVDINRKFTRKRFWTDRKPIGKIKKSGTYRQLNRKIIKKNQSKNEVKQNQARTEPSAKPSDDGTPPNPQNTSEILHRLRGEKKRPPAPPTSWGAKKNTSVVSVCGRKRLQQKTPQSAPKTPLDMFRLRRKNINRLRR